MLHARYAGESFGLACAEFSSKNKPVITYSDSMGKNHLKVLGEKAFTYKNKQDVLNILRDLDKKQINCKEWNMYQEYTPEKVIAKFDSIYKL
jgi:predicted choloylglycine hydrolase